MTESKLICVFGVHRNVDDLSIQKYIVLNCCRFILFKGKIYGVPMPVINKLKEYFFLAVAAVVLNNRGGDWHVI